jgi:DNA-binding FrmR family transcriptional regulator
MDEQARRELCRRLSRIEGQARGIKRMVEEGQEAAALLVQLMAVQQAVRAAATGVVKAQAIAQIREQVSTALAQCPGTCAHCDDLRAIERVLADLDLDALVAAHLKVST